MDFFTEAGAVTTVGVKANGFDARVGEDSGGNGCMKSGCRARLTREGKIENRESR